MEQPSIPRKKSTPISQLPDVQPPQPKQVTRPVQQRQHKQHNSESDDELVQRVLSSMQEPSQVNIQQKHVQDKQPEQASQAENAVSNEEPQSFTNRLMKEGKEPLIVAAIAYLAHQPFVTDLIKKYLPKIVEEGTNNVTTFGFIIKALLIGVLFYIIKKYILK